MSHESGQLLLHYRLAERIGEGGMGVVWKAVDTTLDREVAIKILPEAFAADPERLARFEREAKLLASLNPPNWPSCPPYCWNGYQEFSICCWPMPCKPCPAPASPWLPWLNRFAPRPICWRSMPRFAL